MTGGILPDMPPDIRLVDETFEPRPAPGTTSLYSQPAPIPADAYNMLWLLQQTDPDLRGRVVEAARAVPEETAPESAGAQLVPEAPEHPAAPETESTVAPGTPTPPPDGDAA